MQRTFSIFLFVILLVSISCKKEEKRLNNFRSERDRTLTTLTQSIAQVVTSEDADLNFANVMIAHRQALIVMVDVLLKYSKHDEMKQLATKIKDANIVGKTNLEEFIKQHGPAEKDYGYEMTMTLMREFTSDMTNSINKMSDSTDPDYDYAKMTIIQLQAWPDLAKVELDYGADTEAKTEALRISNQEETINELEKWLSQHGKPQNHRKK